MFFKSGEPITAQKMNEAFEKIGGGVLSKVYPIGSIYLSLSLTNPENLFGGKWERIQGSFLLGADDKNYKANSTGGESEHQITINEMPKHAHTISHDSSNSPAGIGLWYTNVSEGGKWLIVSTGGEAPHHRVWINESGENQPHNNMPPYLAVYMWKRVA